MIPLARRPRRRRRGRGLPSRAPPRTDMPQPEDSGRSPHPRHLPGRFVLASGTLKPWPSATSLFRSCTNFQGTRLPLRPTGFPVYASPVLFGYSPSCLRHSATLDMGRWLALARPGLTPSKIRQASLGAATFEFISGRQTAKPAGERQVQRRVGPRAHACDEAHSRKTETRIMSANCAAGRASEMRARRRT